VLRLTRKRYKSIFTACSSKPVFQTPSKSMIAFLDGPEARKQLERTNPGPIRGLRFNILDL
jgi:hypothetical protein